MADVDSQQERTIFGQNLRRLRIQHRLRQRDLHLLTGIAMPRDETLIETEEREYIWSRPRPLLRGWLFGSASPSRTFAIGAVRHGMAGMI